MNRETAMCTTCGCGGDGATFHAHPAHDHPHDHPHEHRHAHEQRHAGAHMTLAPEPRLVQIEQDLLARNDRQAAINRATFAGLGVLALNLVSSPGSGKTTLLVKTIERLAGSVPVAVIEGDQQTALDAERIRATGAPALQINTGKGCHLDARMVAQALPALPLSRGGLLLIENVGNLVCPAAFDLGEAHRVVVHAVTEGEDKPLKYPDMFRSADVMLLNKCDLLPHLSFDVAQAEAHARRVNPTLRVFRVSATTGEGMDDWLAWLRAALRLAPLAAAR
jgi:hydrogenase nickel incorporation protein HypB